MAKNKVYELDITTSSLGEVLSKFADRLDEDETIVSQIVDKQNGCVVVTTRKEGKNRNLLLEEVRGRQK